MKSSQGKEEGRRFYACSACRDRKDCNFFQWEDEKVRELLKAMLETQGYEGDQRSVVHFEYQLYYDVFSCTEFYCLLL